MYVTLCRIRFTSLLFPNYTRDVYSLFWPFQLFNEIIFIISLKTDKTRPTVICWTYALSRLFLCISIYKSTNIPHQFESITFSHHGYREIAVLQMFGSSAAGERSNRCWSQCIQNMRTKWLLSVSFLKYIIEFVMKFVLLFQSDASVQISE